MKSYLVFLFVILFLLSGCVNKPETAQEQGLPSLPRNEVLRMGFLTEQFGTLHPLLINDSNTENILSILFSPIWDFDEDWNPYPVLIEKVPFIDYRINLSRFKLKQSFKWSDGSNLTARDILLGHPGVIHPYFNKDMLGIETAKRLRGVRPLGKYQFEVRWKGKWSFPYLGYNYPVKEDFIQVLLQGGDLTKSLTAFQNNPISNGPFKLLFWKADSGGVAIQNEHYTDGIPLFKRIVLIPYSKLEDMTMAMQKRKIDMVISPPSSIFKKLQTISQFKFHSVIGQEGIGIWINTDHQWLESQELRRALLLSIPRKQLMEKVLFDSGFNSGNEAYSWLPPKHPVVQSVLPQKDVDDAVIRFLLSEAGWEIGPNKMLIHAGKSLSALEPVKEELMLDFAFSEGDPLAKEVVDFLEEVWKKIGIRINRVEVPRNKYKTFLQQRKFTALAFGRIERGPLTEPMNLWHSLSIPASENGWGGENLSGWRDEKNDKLCENIISANDHKKRKALYAEHQLLFAEAVPFIPLGWLNQIAVARKEIEGLKLRGFGPVTWNIEEWRWQNVK